ncbi:hypothetical protein D3C77_632000 [compost metagenome]
MVTDEVGVEVIQERERTEVEGDAQNRHVVGVHHPVAEAIGLPAGNQLGVALDDGAEHSQVRLRRVAAFGKVRVEHVLGEGALLLGLAGVIEILEMTEADMARRQAQEHGRTLLGFAPHRRA